MDITRTPRGTEKNVMVEVMRYSASLPLCQSSMESNTTTRFQARDIFNIRDYICINSVFVSNFSVINMQKMNYGTWVRRHLAVGVGWLIRYGFARGNSFCLLLHTWQWSLVINNTQIFASGVGKEFRCSKINNRFNVQLSDTSATKLTNWLISQLAHTSFHCL